MAETHRPTLALCMIAKNEERFLGDCLASARPFVDEIVVVDTGSADRTRAIALEHGARVLDFAWCDDFAAARNASLDAADAEWILVLDADERLDPAGGPLLREIIAAGLPNGAHALCPLIDNRRLGDNAPLTKNTSVPRLFRNRRDIRFSGAIHEAVTYRGDPKRTVFHTDTRVRVIHYGYDPEVAASRDKDARNLRMLERELARRDDPRLLFMLLQQHLFGGRDREVVAVFERLARRAAVLPRPFQVQAMASHLAALARLGEHAKLERAVAAAERQRLLGSPALELLSEYCAGRGALERAIACRTQQLRTDLPHGLTEGRPAAEVRLALADLLKRKNDGPAALSCLAAAFDAVPEERRPLLAIDSAVYAMQIGDLVAAGQWVERAMDAAPESLEVQQAALQASVQLARLRERGVADGWWSAIDRALAEDDLQAMYDRAFDLPLTLAGVVRVLAVVQRLREADERQAALGLLNRALDGPRVAPLYQALIQTLCELGRTQEAQLALQALEALQQSPSKFAA